jgi:fructokinase
MQYERSKNMRIGIDFGGTKTEVIGLHARNGKELFRYRVPTKHGDYDATIKTMVDLVESAEQTTGKTGTVGVCVPGPIYSSTGLTGCPNTPWINDRPFKADLQKALNREIRMENDANCFVVSEATDGAAAGKNNVFGMIIGTGCGGGFYINGQVVSGLNGLAGECGHVPLPYPRVFAPDDIDSTFNISGDTQRDGNPIYVTKNPTWSEYPGEVWKCGRRGTWETWLSGSGFKMDYQRVTGENLSTHDIIENANRGNKDALDALERYCDRMARCLSFIINLIDPEVIVLGGGMSNVKQIYDSVPKLWGDYVYADKVLTQLKPPRHGDSSGVRGAAWLWPKAT